MVDPARVVVAHACYSLQSRALKSVINQSGNGRAYDQSLEDVIQRLAVETTWRSGDAENLGVRQRRDSLPPNRRDGMVGLVNDQ